MKKMFAIALVISTLGIVALPAISRAQNYETYRQHRDKERNKWRDLAIGSGILGIIGITQHNDTLTAIGVGGAVYSTYRYSEDGKRHYRTYSRPVYVRPVPAPPPVVFVPVYRRDDWRWRHDNGRHLGWYKHHHEHDEDEDEHHDRGLHLGWYKGHHDNGNHNGWFKAKPNGWLRGDQDGHGNKWFKGKDKERGGWRHGKDKD